MKNKVKLNYIYSVLYQLFTMVIPLVTTPYLSRVLHANGIGQYAYTYALVNYFVILAQLGFGYYAQREIAKYQNNKQKQSIVFFEIMILKSISVFICIAIYSILCISGIFGDYTSLMWCWIILIFTQGIDISFLYKGNEEFGKVVGRNFLIKITGILWIFMFVKKADDVWLYVLAIAISHFLGALSTWVYLPKFVEKVQLCRLNPLKHLIPTLQLFIPTVAGVIYTYVDRALIGALVKGTLDDGAGIIRKLADLENGYYEQSQKIITISTSVITALGGVMLPRNANEFAKGNIEGVKNNLAKAFQFCFFVGMPMMFGICAIAENMVPWFFGEGFEKCVVYLRLFSPIVMLLGFDNVLGIQFLITTGKDKQYTFSVIAGTVINIVFNVIFIPKLLGTGAIIASIISELSITVTMMIFAKDYLFLSRFVKENWKYVSSSFIMFLLVYLLQLRLEPMPVNTLILVIVGGIIYISLLLALRDEFVIKNFKQVLLKIKLTK